MKRSIFTAEKRKAETTNKLKPNEKRDKPSQYRIKSNKNNLKRIDTKMDISKYNTLNRDINKIVRTINLLFDFKIFKKEKLQSLEPVRYHFKI